MGYRKSFKKGRRGGKFRRNSGKGYSGRYVRVSRGGMKL